VQLIAPPPTFFEMSDVKNLNETIIYVMVGNTQETISPREGIFNRKTLSL